MKIYEFVNKSAGGYGLNGIPIQPEDLLLIYEPAVNQTTTASTGLNKIGNDIRLGDSNLIWAAGTGLQYAGDWEDNFTLRTLVTKQYVDGLINNIEPTIQGTPNYLSKFTSPNGLVPSQIFDNGISIGIGTDNLTGSAKLFVNGTINHADAILLTESATLGQVQALIGFGNGYVHPAKTWVDKTNLSGATVISNLTINSLGHPTDWTTRNITPASIGAQIAGSYDNYVSWNLKTNGFQRIQVTKDGDLDLVAGSNITVSYSAGGVVTISASNSIYTHPVYTSINQNLTGATVLASFVSDSIGSITGITTRSLTLSDLGYVGAINANNYVHPTYTIINQNLTGATVLASFVSDSIGSITNISTRTLTLANLGYTGAIDANNYIHPSYTLISQNLTGATVLSSFTTDALGSVTGFTTRTLTLANLGGQALILGTPTNGFIATIVSGVPTWVSPIPITLNLGDLGDVVITSPTVGHVLTWNGTNFVFSAQIGGTGGGGGTITQITTGTGLTGGVITSSGTIGVNFGTIAGTVAQGNDSRFHVPVSLGGDVNGLSLATQVLSLSLASITVSGAMSFTDKVKLDGLNNYVHPTQSAIDTTLLTGVSVISRIIVNSLGHVTTISTRTLTLGDLGYTGATNANNYVHPIYTPINQNLTGATVLSSFTTDALGSVTGFTTRTLTLTNLGGQVAIAGTPTNGFIATIVSGVPTWIAPTLTTLNLGDLGDVDINSPVIGHVLSWNGTNFVLTAPIGGTGGGGGTITQITTGTGLTGGVITSSGTIGVNFGTIAGTVAQGNDSRFHVPVSLGVNQNGLSLATQVLSLSLASITVSGAMSFTDKVKLDGLNNYVHPVYIPLAVTLSGAQVLASFNSDSIGSATGITTRVLTLANLGYTGATNANNYIHPVKIWVDKVNLSDNNVISNLAIDSLGHLTDWTTRALTLADLGYTGVTNADRYLSWNLITSGTVGTASIGSGDSVSFVGGLNTTITRLGTVVTISSSASPQIYTHPSKTWVDKTNLSGATVISNLTIDSLGHPTNWTVRNLTPADIGAQIAGSYDNYVSWNLRTNGIQRISIVKDGVLDIVGGANVSVAYNAGGVITINSTDTNTIYTHPTYTPINQNLTGATVLASFISDTIGSIAGITTRTLTLADLGAEASFLKGNIIQSTGISIAGTLTGRLYGTGNLTFQNTDRGSSQNIFKNVANSLGVNQFSATENNDSIRFVGSGTSTVSFDPITKTIIISSANSGLEYIHPVYTVRNIDTVGAQVIDIISSDNLGSITNITTRNLTLADLGFSGAVNANNYIHPDKVWVDKTALSGSTVISNITIDSLGHPTDWITRNLTLANLGYTGVTNADRYLSWNLTVSETVGTASILSGGTVSLVGGLNTTITRLGNVVTISSSSPSQTYTHPVKTWVDKTNLSGAIIISNITVDALGHLSDWSTRNITLLDLGYFGANNANLYIHPEYIVRNIDTVGAQVIDIISSDNLGSITNITTRNLTLAELGYSGANNANFYIHPAYIVRNIDTSGAQIIDAISSDGLGSITNITTRNLTLADLGFSGAVNANNYIHPIKVWVDKVDLTGNNVIANLTINSLGHPIDWTTRALTLANLGYTGVTNADRYLSWNLAVSETAGTSSVLSGGTVSLVGGLNTTITRLGNVVTISSSSISQSYIHPTKAWVDKVSLSGNLIISNLLVDSLGHPTNWTTRSLLLSDLGYVGATNANFYIHPAYIVRNIDTSGAQVIDIISSDGLGSITNITTRNLTLAELGYVGAVNADRYIAWDLAVAGIAGQSNVTSGSVVTFTAGSNVNINRVGNNVTISAITVSTPETDTLQSVTSRGFITTVPQLNIGQSTGNSDVNFNLGQGRTANGNAFMDFHSALGGADFDFRIIKNSGAAGLAEFRNVAGPIQIITQSASNIDLNTAGESRLFIQGGSGNVGIGNTAPLNKLHITGGLTVSDGGAGVPSGVEGFHIQFGSDLVSRLYSVNNGTNWRALEIQTASTNFITNGLSRMIIESGGNIAINGESNLTFGSNIRQMINLFGTTYGIGIQAGTQYFRTGSRFSWFRGGTHSNTENNSGGGSVLMSLNQDALLTLSGNINVNGGFIMSGASLIKFSDVTGNVALPISTNNLLVSNNYDGHRSRVPINGIYALGDIASGGDVIAFTTSDKRFKDNILRIEDSLTKISKISGYTFDWNEKQNRYRGSDYGVLAQEIEEVFPEMVTTREDGYKAVKYDRLIPVLIEAVKSLTKEINKLKNNG